MVCDRFFNGVLAALFLLLGGLSAVGMYLLDIAVRPEQLVGKLGLCAAVLGGALLYHRRGADRLADALLAVFWMGLFSNLHVFPMFVCGRVPCDFRDADLAAADALLGLRTPDVMAAVERLPDLRDLLQQTYETLVYLIVLAILLPPLLGKTRRFKEYIVACIVSVLVAFPLFAVFQAQGTWVHYGYAPAINQDEYLRTFAALKREPHYVMDLDYSRGLIMFPSFHTILAVLSAVAVASVPYVRWLAGVWAALIVISTVTTGTHYVVDVLAGLAVAGVAAAAAKGFGRLERRRAQTAATSP